MTATENTDSPYMTVDEAAAAMRISRNTLYELLKRGLDPVTDVAYVNGVPLAYNRSQSEHRSLWRVIRAAVDQQAGLPAEDDDPRPVERAETVMGF